MIEIYCLVYFPQQMSLWYQALYSHYFDYITIQLSAFQHPSHHLLLLYLF